MKRILIALLLLAAMTAHAQRYIENLDIGTDLDVGNDVQVDGDLNVDGSITGTVAADDITADTITMSEGEGEGVITGYLVGNVTGDLTGDLTGDSAGTHTGNVTGGDVTADSLVMNEGEGEGRITMVAGTASLPSIHATGDPNTGPYSGGADTWCISTGGTLRLTYSTTAITSTLPIVVPNGSGASAAIQQAGYPGTGIYFPGSSSMAVAIGNVQRCAWDSTGTTSPLGFQTSSAYSQSAYRLDYATDTGIGGNSTTITHRIGGVEYETITAAANTRTYSGGEYTRLHTNYYTGAAHNSVTYRAARGTSASPDYLDNDDALGYLKWEARDGAGTWGDGAEIKVEALEDHSAGDTGTEIVFYTTPERGTSDTQERVAAVGSYDLLTAYDLPALDCSLFYPRTAGAGWLFGYIGDLAGLGAYTGLVMILDTTGQIPVMIGEDTYMYFGDGAGNVLADDTWRIGGDGSDGFTAEQYDSSGDTWAKHFRVSENGAEVNSDEAFYLGDPDTDGSWRIIRDGNNLVHQRRESSTWTTKDTITP